MAATIDRIEAHAEVFRGLEYTIIKDNLRLFVPPEDKKKWQPSDYIPDLATEGVSVWQDKCAVIRNQAQTLSRPLRVVIIGDLVTEEALSSYAMALARLRGIEDVDGIADNPIAQHRRLWLGDENRHGEILSDWAKLSGLFNMRAVQQTTHRLIVNGFENGAGLDLYPNIFFVVKQEKFTALAHRRSGKLSVEQQQAGGVDGDSIFGEFSNEIGKEEDIHHPAYFNIWDGIVAIDPAGAVIAQRDMMRVGTIMPAKYMSCSSGHRTTELFDKYARIAHQIGILTPTDNVELDEKIIKRTKVGTLSLSGEAAQAQEEIFQIHDADRTKAKRIEEVVDRVRAAGREPDTSSFNWLLPEAA